MQPARPAGQRRYVSTRFGSDGTETQLEVNSPAEQSQMDPSQWRSILGPPPPIHADYSVWLDYQKRKWRMQRDARKLRQAAMAKQGGVGALAARSLRNGPASTATFMRAAATALVRSEWHILQIVESSHPGFYNIWALVEVRIHP